MWENTFLMFSPPSLWSFVTVAWESNTCTGNKRFWTHTSNICTLIYKLHTVDTVLVCNNNHKTCNKIRNGKRCDFFKLKKFFFHFYMLRISNVSFWHLNSSSYPLHVCVHTTLCRPMCSNIPSSPLEGLWCAQQQTCNCLLHTSMRLVRYSWSLLKQMGTEEGSGAQT